jgi:hypothetical protein
MNESLWRGRLISLAWWLGLSGTLLMLVLMTAMAQSAGWLGPPADIGTKHTGNTTFMMKVGHAGETVFTGFVDVGEEVREEVAGKVYPSPEEAVEAVEKVPTVQALGGNPASAHAVSWCTHSRSGVVSDLYAGSRHLTWFRKHYNGRHYQTTVHQVYSFGWVTTATYKYNYSIRYCG